MGLIAKAEQGDQTAYRAVRAVFDAHPHLWDQMADYAHLTERAWIEAIAGATALLFTAALERKVAELRRDLTPEPSTRLERLVIDRVVLCWLQVYQADGIAAQELARGVTFEALEFHQRRQDRAHRRYLAALKTLATVRKVTSETKALTEADLPENMALLKRA